MEQQKTLRDGVPFFLKPSDRSSIGGTGGARAASLVCLSEKVGSTAWKLLFVKALAAQGLSKFDLRASPHKVHVTQLSHEEQQRMLADPAVLRFMFVRDPYSRLLSGFLDKASTMQRWRESRLPLPCKQTRGASKAGADCYAVGAPFSKFVEVAVAAPQLNAHFELLSKHCLLPNGMTYDYFLKVERRQPLPTAAAAPAPATSPSESISSASPLLAASRVTLPCR